VDRRSFICTLAGGLLAAPLGAGAQKAASPRRIGFLLVGLSPASRQAQHFRQGMRDAGYAEGRDIIIEWRSAKGDYGQVQKLIDEFVQNKVDVIVVDSTVAAQVAKRTTSTIPIVMALVLDPVGTGLVASLASPGGNVTGLSMNAKELIPKRLELIKETLPNLVRVAVLWNPDHQFHVRMVEEIKLLAPRVSMDLTFLSVRTPDQFPAAVSHASQARAQALWVVDDPIFYAHRSTLLGLAAQAKIPTIHELSRWVEEGGLMSYGPDIHDLFYRSASYVDRIFKGAKPSELPVEEPRKFELFVNLRTAKTHNLKIPPAILARADGIIE
jgi:putative ABC transport system substrate-binding protein